jgi:hypothetical protein
LVALRRSRLCSSACVLFWWFFRGLAVRRTSMGLRSHFSARPALVSFDVLSWPTTMEVLLDLQENIASDHGSPAPSANTKSCAA